MSEGPSGRGIEVLETNRFSKTLAKLPADLLENVEDQIERIIEAPTIGVRKKGDLSFLRVHKFNVHAQEMLLGYSWIEDKLTLYLLSLGSHENFYLEQKRHSKADLKLISGT